MPNSSPDAAGVPAAIGTMTAADLDEVLEIERLSFPTPWTRAHFLAELGNPVARLPVVRDPAGKIVAYACAWEVAGELQVNDVAVHPAWRRRGLARAILAALLADAGARGCVGATLEVRTSNVPARDLYAAFGFREIGRRRGYYEDTGEDAIVMSLRLGPSEGRSKGARA